MGRAAEVGQFSEHLRRHEKENETEKFSGAPAGTFERFYTKEARAKPLTEPGWCRVWVYRFGGKVVAHASAFDVGEEDGVVYGHIGIEKPYRGWGIAKELQTARFAFLDEHNLTLVGSVALGNDHSFHGCRKAGYEFLRFDPHTQETVVYRPPGAQRRG